jgi:hypothetical protein
MGAEPHSGNKMSLAADWLADVARKELEQKPPQARVELVFYLDSLSTEARADLETWTRRMATAVREFFGKAVQLGLREGEGQWEGSLSWTYSKRQKARLRSIVRGVNQFHARETRREKDND